MQPLDLSCAAGAGGFETTPSDLVRFGLKLEGGRLLRGETVRSLVVGGDGKLLGGHVLSLLTIPDRGLAVAVMGNLAEAGTDTIAMRISEIFAN